MRSGNTCVFICFVVLFAEVASWTIDLPQVRRYLFEKHDAHKQLSKNQYDDYANNDRVFYSNIQGNSKHNTEENKMYDHYDKENYANEFKYQSYMEKKVLEIVHDGSRYLEGLRRSLEDYNSFLQHCNRWNMSMIQNSTVLPLPPPYPNVSMPFNATGGQFQGFNTTFQMMTSIAQSGFNNTGGTRQPRVMTSCREATEASEKVRRYADLAMWATRRLQDLAYAENYQKTDQYEENELILKLAWFLDQLAHLTGYEPDHEQYLPRRTTTVPTTSPTPITMVPQTDALRDYLINCVKANSSLPATVRCNYPLPLPSLVAQIVGGTTSTTSPQPQISDVLPPQTVDSITQQSNELLITADNYRNPRKITKRSPIPDEYYVPIPVHEKPKPIVDFIVKKLSNLKAIVKSVKKHTVEDFASQVAYHKHIHKRSVDEDTSLLVNRLSNNINLKPVDKLLKAVVDSVESVVKSDKTNVKSEETDVKSEEIVVKSNDKRDEPIIEFISPIHFPVSDVVVNTKSFKKRSIDDKSISSNLINKMSKQHSTVKINVKSVNKRSVDDPLSKLTSYYVKYKVWDNSNPLHAKNDEKTTSYDIDNHLQPKMLTKRSLFFKKNKHLRFPKSFLTPNSNKRQSKKNVGKKGKDKLLSYLGNAIEKKYKKYGNRHKIFKRSLIYEDMYLPRIPINPVWDISYYVKNKEGRYYNPSVVQAALVRLGLQQVFETGNLAVVQRYGSNYNPAILDTFNTGVIKGMADS